MSFVLVYTNQDGNSKRFKFRGYFLTKSIMKSYNVIINGKNFYDQTVCSDVKRYEVIKKLPTRQGKDYTNGCLLGYDYIENIYKLIVVGLSRQNKLSRSKKSSKNRICWAIKKCYNATDKGDDRSMFVLTILEKTQRSKIKEVSQCYKRW